MNHDILTRYTNIDYDREIAIIAEISEGKKNKMIGVVRFLGDPDMNTAEVAIILGDPWQKKGIGGMLLDYGLTVAKSEGIKHLYAYVLEDNDVMLHMFRERKFTVTRDEDSFKVRREL